MHPRFYSFRALGSLQFSLEHSLDTVGERALGILGSQEYVWWVHSVFFSVFLWEHKIYYKFSCWKKEQLHSEKKKIESI